MRGHAGASERSLADGLRYLVTAIRPDLALAGAGLSGPRGPILARSTAALPDPSGPALRPVPDAGRVGDDGGDRGGDRGSDRGNDRSGDRAGAAGDDVPDLVRRAQDGDADAFGALYDRYVDLVYRYIYYRVGSRALAEDLTSETFLRALRRVRSFTWQGKDIGAWFVTIARNLIADHYKSGRYRLEVQVADMLDADRAQDGPEREVLDSLTNRVLLEAVKGLNPEQQECIVLRFLQGLSVAETALAMGKNEGAIKALQYRAVRTLGRLLPTGFTP